MIEDEQEEQILEDESAEWHEHHPYDHFYHDMFENKDLAADLFSYFLPEEFRGKVRLDQLQEEKDKFIVLKDKRECDLVFRAPYVDEHGTTPFYFVTFLEHQSSVDKMMPIRMITYAGAILLNYKKRYQNERLPLVLPVVIYTGEKGWTAKRDVTQLFGEYASFIKRYWFHDQIVLDVNRLSTEELVNSLSGLILMTLYTPNKKYNVEEMREYVEHFAAAVSEGKLGKCATMMLEFLANHADATTYESLLANQHIFNRELQENIMHAGQVLRQQGYQHGYEECARANNADIWNTAMHEGENKKAKDMAFRLLKVGVDRNLVAETSGLSLEEIEKIEKEGDSTK